MLIFSQVFQKILSWFLLIGLSYVCQAQTLMPFLQEGKYGYADSTGTIIIQPEYDKVSFFGVPAFFYENLKVLAPRYIPKDLAEVKKDKSYYLIDKNGKQLIKSAGPDRLKFGHIEKAPNANQSAMYKKETLAQTNYVKVYDLFAKSWGILDQKNSSTEGLIYMNDVRMPLESYAFQNQDVQEEKKIESQPNQSDRRGTLRRFDFRESPNHDLNPFRGSASRQPVILLAEGQCQVARRITGEYDLLSFTGALLKTQNEKFVDSDCLKVKQEHKDKFIASEITITKRGAKTSKKKKRKNYYDQQIGDKGFILTDTLGNELFKNEFDKTNVFALTMWQRGAVGFNEKKQQLKIYGTDGRQIYKCKATEIPKSITASRLGLSESVFIKAKDHKVLINKKGDEIFKANRYQNVLCVNQTMYLAFLEKEAAVPFDIYDNNWKKLHPGHIVDIEKTSVDYILTFTNESGDTTEALFNSGLKLLDNLEGINQFSSIDRLRKNWLRHKVEQHDDKLYPYKLSLLEKPITNLDMQQRLVDRMNKNNRAGRKPQPDWRCYTFDENERKRIILTKDNFVWLDTFAQDLIHVDIQNNLARVSFKDSLKDITLIKMEKAPFLKTYVLPSKLYKITSTDSTKVYNEDGLFLSYKNGYNNDFRLWQLTDDRYFNDFENRLLIFNKEGEVLDEIKILDKAYKNTAPAFGTTEIVPTCTKIDDRHLRVNETLPYFYDYQNFILYKK